MIASPLARAWDEHKALDFILDHHPRVQAQREAVSAEKSLNRLPVLEAMISERSSAAAALDAAERAEAQVRETAREQTAAAQRAVKLLQPPRNGTPQSKRSAAPLRPPPRHGRTPQRRWNRPGSRRATRNTTSNAARR
ncbi:MAG: hypothetical protein IPL59_15095 [Candidatus Competibacteraceae bacterium]|nr:hypothetical protein [Candidatus Competibacteraceae bacterium]